MSFDDLDVPREGVLLMLVLEACHGDIEIDNIIITLFFDQNNVHMPMFKIFQKARLEIRIRMDPYAT